LTNLARFTAVSKSAINPATLQQYPIIGMLEDQDQQAILPYLCEHQYEDGSIILHQGQSSDRFHIVLSGIVDVRLEREIEVSVAKLKHGQFVGEMSCITGELVSATVRAEGLVQTISMPKEGVYELMDRSASFRKQMLEAMIKRISKSNERVMEEHTRSFVVLRQLEQEQQSRYGPLHGNSPFICEFRNQLNAAAQHDRPLCIIGERGTGKLHAASELHYQSMRRQHPLLMVDGASFLINDWELKLRAAKGGTIILEHADQLSLDVLNRLITETGAAETRIILTAQTRLNRDFPIQTLKMIPLRERTDDIPELVYEFLAAAGVHNPMEAIAEEAMRMILLFPFLGENIEELKRVVQEAVVLSGGKIIRTAHLRFGSARPPGVRPKIGLALGSGSVRGAAHVGVLKVLEEEKIPVDMIAGSSVGAFIGALYAGGQPISAFERVLPTVRWRQLAHLRLSTGGFMDNRLMARFVEKYIGPVDFEELSIPFAAVASDAITGEPYILNTGRVSEAICASTAIPGVMKPVAYKNRLLADGGVAHPVPAALVRSMGADIVIAVNLSIPSSGRGAAKNFISSILNTIEIMSGRIVQDELQLADVVLHPQFGVNHFTFKASPYYIQAGEHVTRDAISTIKSKLG
jgi:predicted acylesterase/phospholipase RssA/CRP-like cAMP-binding protein